MIADFSAEDLGTTAWHTIDVGGGAFDSVGENCLRGGLLAAFRELPGSAPPE